MNPVASAATLVVLKKQSALLGLIIAMPIVGLLNLPRSLGQQSVSLVPVADTTLHEAFPTNNFGGGTTFTSGGRNLGGRARALLKFDVAGSLPSGATLVSASLTVTVTAANGPGSVFSLHRVGSNWGEGNGSDFGFGSPGGAGEATWNDRLGPGTPWATAGGDYVPALSASTFLNQPGQYAFTSPGLLNDLQLWLAQPGTNFGWLLRSEDEHIAGTIRRFGGRLHEDNPPRLQITFTVPVPAPVITNTLYTNGLIQFEFLARSNRAYRVETRASVTGGLWTTLTNFPAQPADTQWSFSTPATGPERYFRVATP